MAATNFITCNSDEEFGQLLLDHELQEGVRFSVRKSRHAGVSRVDSLLHCRVLFEDGGRQSVPVAYDGTPFIVIRSDVLECQYGSGRAKKEENIKGDHSFGCTGTPRRHIQDTKKMDCPAKIKLRRIIKFPEYQIQISDSKWKRLKVSKELKDGFCADTSQQYQVIIQFVGEHNGHITGKTIKYVTKRLTESLLIQRRDPVYPATGLRISTLEGLAEGSELRKVFNEHKL